MHEYINFLLLEVGIQYLRTKSNMLEFRINDNFFAGLCSQQTSSYYTCHPSQPLLHQECKVSSDLNQYQLWKYVNQKYLS